MAGTILAIFLFIIIVGIVYWGSTSLLAAFGVGDPLKTVIVVGVVLLLLLLALAEFFGGGGSGCLGTGSLHLR